MKKAFLIAIVLAFVGTTVYAFRTPRVRERVTAAVGNALYPGKSLSVPMGTDLTLRLRDRLDADESHAGDVFRATLVDPVRVNGEVAIPAGAEVSGHVIEAVPAGHVSGHGRLQLYYDELTYGTEHFGLDTRSQVYGSRSAARRSAANIGGGAVIGGLIGGLAGHSGGSALAGAVVGGAAGTAVSMAGRRPDVVLAPGTLLRVHLDHELTVHVPPV